jgi:hypothetical protein
MIWGFSDSLKDKPSPKQRATAPVLTQARPSEFENEGAVLLHVPVKAPDSKPTISSVLPKELFPGVDTMIRLFGNNFDPETRIITASVSGDVDVLTLKIVSEELIEATLLVSPEMENAEVALFALNPDGARSRKQVLQVLSSH